LSHRGIVYRYFLQLSLVSPIGEKAILVKIMDVIEYRNAVQSLLSKVGKTE